jgi:glutamate formiminotransferase
VLECVPNVSEGRDRHVLDALVAACGAALLDLHADADHHRAVLSIVGDVPRDTIDAVARLAHAVAATIDLRQHAGAHPRFGALDVVPFVALDDRSRELAAHAAGEIACVIADGLGVPVFFYGDADPLGRGLPDARRDAFVRRPPDLGPRSPHPRLGATAVGARPPLVAVNCVLDADDGAAARSIAKAVRERDGGLPGVRALAFLLSSQHRWQVSMNLTDLDRTGLQRACDEVRARAHAAGHEVAQVELVGLVPADELARCEPEFLAWAGIGPDDTIEARVAARRAAGGN